MTATPAQADVDFVQSITKQLEGVFAAFEAGTLPLSDALLSALEQAKRELCVVNLTAADERVVLRRDLACGWIDAILLSRSARAAGAPAVPYMISAGVRAAASTAAPAMAPAPLSAPAPAAPVALASPAAPPAPVAPAAPAAQAPAGVGAPEPVAVTAEVHSRETSAHAVRSRGEIAIPDKRRGPLLVLLALLVVVLVAAVVIAGGVVHIPALQGFQDKVHSVL
jgi:hypothetical protein